MHHRTLCLVAASALFASSSARATDLAPVVKASIHDAPINGTGDSFNAAPFEGLLRKAGGMEDRAIQEFDAAPFAGGLLLSATLSGTIFSNNAYDVGVRTFDFTLYSGNGTPDLSDFQIASVVVGSGNYHPPITTSFTYSFDVTAAVQTLFTGGATWIGLKVVCTSDPNYPDILDDGTSKLALVIAATTGAPFCAGDGSATACPCGNFSPPGSEQGCQSSLGIGGKLTGTGIASVTNDSFRIDGTNLPNSPGLFFQGTGLQNGGNGAIFGDGLRCVAGVIIRLGTRAAVGGASHYPDVGDAPISVRGLVPPSGGNRYYQLWYRNAADFCTTGTFNLTNGLGTTWVP